jgi:hypothetical protein
MGPMSPVISVVRVGELVPFRVENLFAAHKSRICITPVISEDVENVGLRRAGEELNRSEQ